MFRKPKPLMGITPPLRGGLSTVYQIITSPAVDRVLARGKLSTESIVAENTGWMRSVCQDSVRLIDAKETKQPQYQYSCGIQFITEHHNGANAPGIEVSCANQVCRGPEVIKANVKAGNNTIPRLAIGHAVIDLAVRHKEFLLRKTNLDI